MKRLTTGQGQQEQDGLPRNPFWLVRGERVEVPRGWGGVAVAVVARGEEQGEDKAGEEDAQDVGGT